MIPTFSVRAAPMRHLWHVRNPARDGHCSGCSCPEIRRNPWAPVGVCPYGEEVVWR